MLAHHRATAACQATDTTSRVKRATSVKLAVPTLSQPTGEKRAPATLVQQTATASLPVPLATAASPVSGTTRAAPIPTSALVAHPTTSIQAETVPPAQLVPPTATPTLVHPAATLVLLGMSTTPS